MPENCNPNAAEKANKFQQDRTTRVAPRMKRLMDWTLLPKHCGTPPKTRLHRAAKFGRYQGRSGHRSSALINLDLWCERTQCGL